MDIQQKAVVWPIGPKVIRLSISAPQGAGKTFFVDRYLVPALSRAPVSFQVYDGDELTCEVHKPSARLSLCVTVHDDDADESPAAADGALVGVYP